jgi:hypothetical protein
MCDVLAAGFALFQPQRSSFRAAISSSIEEDLISVKKKNRRRISPILLKQHHQS